MDLLTTPEQDEIVSSSAALLTDQMSTTHSRALFEAGTVPAVSDTAWASAAGIGWFGLGLPEARGGIGYGLADEVLLVREIGRTLAAGPFIATILGARVAAFAGDQALGDEIVAGRRVGLAIAGLDGALQIVDADTGHDALVLVVTPADASLVTLGSLADVSEVPCLDPTARLQRATNTGAAPVASIAAHVDPIELRGHVLAAAMLTGIVEWSRDTASRHAIDRVQFDRPIGVNQAIKHPCADMAVQSQLAYSQALFAGLAIDEGRADGEFHALSAHVTAAQAAEFATGATLQVMGGMGFTHEHDVHLYVKRAELWSHAFGGIGAQLQRLLDLPEPA
jgi:alkylation response protein AidB-like acyl-CoA dehydrogenase